MNEQISMLMVIHCAFLASRPPMPPTSRRAEAKPDNVPCIALLLQVPLFDHLSLHWQLKVVSDVMTGLMPQAATATSG
jgi:hypothetical protein